MEVSICCSAVYTTDTSQMAEYTLNERTDMHLLYGETRGNGCAARRLYAERFPMRRLPSHVLFQRIHARESHPLSSAASSAYSMGAAPRSTH